MVPKPFSESLPAICTAPDMLIHCFQSFMDMVLLIMPWLEKTPLEPWPRCPWTQQTSLQTW